MEFCMHAPTRKNFTRSYGPGFAAQKSHARVKRAHALHPWLALSQNQPHFLLDINVRLMGPPDKYCI